MTCKDCLTLDLCEEIKFQETGVNISLEGSNICSYFKDKSKVIELPNFVYVIDCDEIEKCKCLGFFKTNNELWLDTKSEREQILIPISNYNKTWFFKKSKAEEKLKELNENV